MKKRLVKDEKKCIRCGNCERVCSKAFFKEVNRDKSYVKVSQGDDGYANIDISPDCVACGLCARNCPTGALKMEEYEE